MAEKTLVTAVEEKLSLFVVRVVQKSVTGSVEKILFAGDVIALSSTAAQAIGVIRGAQANSDADPSRFAVNVTAVPLV
jgi:hypothetical protein